MSRVGATPGVRATAGLGLAWMAVVAAAYYRTLAHPDPGDRILGLGLGLREGWGLPHLPEAASAALTALGGALFLLASATLLGRWMTGLAGWDAETPRVALAVAAGVAALAQVGHVLALGGLYRPAVLRAVAALPFAVGAWRAATGRAGPGWWRPPRPACSRRDAAFAACAGLAGGAAFVAALAPEIEYDALWYHLYFPRLALDRGGLVDLPAEYVSLFPMSFDLWLGYGLAFGGAGTAKLLHFACLPLAAAFVHAMVKRHAPAASRWLGVALFVSAPLVLWEASTAYVDLALALYVALATHALLLHLETGRRRWLVLAGLALGFSLASKHVALLALAAALVVVVAAGWRGGRAWRRTLVSCVALATVALVPALPWYARSARLTGDPFFPTLYRHVGAPSERWDEASQKGLEGFLHRFGRPRTLSHQAALPWDMTLHPARYGGTVGPLFLALLPMLAVARPRRGLARVALLGGLYFVLWASPLASFQARWLVPVLPLAAVLAAAGHAALVARLRAARLPARGALRVGLLVLLVLNLPPFAAFHEADRAGWKGWLTHTLHGLPLGVVAGRETRESYLESRVGTRAAWRFVGASLPADARVLAYAGGDHFYSSRDRIPALSATARRTAFAPAGGEDEALAGLRALGVTHVLVDRAFLSDYGFDADTRWDDFATTGARARALWYDAVYEDARAVVYRLRPASAVRGAG